jgi:hypothetical protein
MINDYLNKQIPPQPPAPVELQPIVPLFGIGECVVFKDGTTAVLYVTVIIIRGAGLFTYLVSEHGSEMEVRDFEICSYDSLPDAEDDE